MALWKYIHLINDNQNNQSAFAKMSDRLSLPLLAKMTAATQGQAAAPDGYWTKAYFEIWGLQV